MSAISVRSIDKADAPRPGAPLRDVVIHPDNIAAEQRRSRARQLPLMDRLRMSARAKRLRRVVTESPHYALYQKMETLRPKMRVIHEQQQQYRYLLAVNPNDSRIQREYSVWKQNNAHDIKRWLKLQARLEQLIPLARELQQIEFRLQEHRDAVMYERQLREDEKELKREAQIFEKLLISKLTALGYCYKRHEGKKEVVETVKFAEVGMALDAHWFEIDASYKTAFENWKTNLPQGVRIGEDLLNESTLTELSFACTRQVFGARTDDNTRAWIVVSRLDSSDGMLKYVSWRDLQERYPTDVHARMPVGVGVAKHRVIQWVTLQDFPHWLIAGSTGAGKSNFVNAAIATLISRHTPNDLRLMLIDLKGGLEFGAYSDIPHLAVPPVTSIDGVAANLAMLEAIMYQRFERMRGRAREFMEFNQRNPNERLPRLLCLFDEVASIQGYKQRTNEIELYIQALTRMGRAVGIHIMLATQRPDVKAISGPIKVNLAARFSGRMPTTTDSITIMGNSIARDLPAIAGRFAMQIASDPVVIQTPHISDTDLYDAINTARAMPEGTNLESVESIEIKQRNEWTVDRVIEISIKHLDGNITAKAIYDACEGLSQSQARQMVESVWARGTIEFEGTTYHVKNGRSNKRMLVAS